MARSTTDGRVIKTVQFRPEDYEAMANFAEKFGISPSKATTELVAAFVKLSEIDKVRMLWPRQIEIVEAASKLADSESKAQKRRAL